MVARSPTHPTDTLARYRQRLTAEMEKQGLSDRSLADLLGKAGMPLAHSGIYRTRQGLRQPTLDECVTVARVLGYETLDGFLRGGPTAVAMTAATARLQNLITFDGPAYRHAVLEALLDVAHAFDDEGVRAALTEADPDWENKYFLGLTHDLRWAMRDQVVLWTEVLNRLAEVFHRELPTYDEEQDGLMAEVRARDEARQRRAQVNGVWVTYEGAPTPEGATK